jgi:aspartyl-tRNA(Asn)/glutamyl-tRNA(Gln) amidotransferase subunit A
VPTILSVDEPPFLTAGELLEGYATRRFSPVEVMETVAARIEQVEPSLHAFVALDLDRAQAEAKRAAASWAAGDPRPLEGVPFAAKDVFDTAGLETTYGSRMFTGHVPAADAVAVRLARDAGAVLVGKTSTHEFAWGLTGWNPAFGSGRNPWSPDHVCGGSSGGSAAAVAVGEVPIALGSDTGGSIRLPAALCGVSGLKPTYGRVDARGVFPLSPSLDHVGVLARSPADTALLLSVLGVPTDLPDAATLRLGVCRDLIPIALAPAVASAFDDAVDCLREALADVRDLGFPAGGRIRATHGPIQQLEVLRVHRQRGLWPARRDEYGPDIAGRLEAAGQVSLEDYLDATVAREQIRADFVELFNDVDVLLTPVCPASPPLGGSEEISHLDVAMPFRELVLPFTSPQNLAGLPACTVRVGFDELGIPIGVQLTSAPGREGAAIAASQALYAETGNLQRRRPAL